MEGLASIPKHELAQWAVYGPEIGRKWPTWKDWAEAYAVCREELLNKINARRERLTGKAGYLETGAELACERLFAALQRGEDPDVLQAQIADEVRENDPRYILQAEN